MMHVTMPPFPKSIEDLAEVAVGRFRKYRVQVGPALSFNTKVRTFLHCLRSKSESGFRNVQPQSNACQNTPSNRPERVCTWLVGLRKKIDQPGNMLQTFLSAPSV